MNLNASKLYKGLYMPLNIFVYSDNMAFKVLSFLIILFFLFRLNNSGISMEEVILSYSILLDTVSMIMQFDKNVLRHVPRNVSTLVILQMLLFFIYNVPYTQVVHDWSSLHLIYYGVRNINLIDKISLLKFKGQKCKHRLYIDTNLKFSLPHALFLKNNQLRVMFLVTSRLCDVRVQ